MGKANRRRSVSAASLRACCRVPLGLLLLRFRQIQVTADHPNRRAAFRPFHHGTCRLNPDDRSVPVPTPQLGRKPRFSSTLQMHPKSLPRRWQILRQDEPTPRDRPPLPTHFPVAKHPTKSIAHRLFISLDVPIPIPSQGVLKDRVDRFLPASPDEHPPTPPRSHDSPRERAFPAAR